MTDYFALLNELRRPWIAAESLKEKFLALSTEAHPDRFHEAETETKRTVTDRYAELNTAYHCLADTKSRLQHLLELETGSRPGVVREVPGDTMDLFMEVAELCRGVDRFLEEKRRAASAILKARYLEKASEWVSEVKALEEKIHQQQEDLIPELQRMNPLWEAAPTVGSPERASMLPLERLDEIFRVQSHCQRWGYQLRERLLQLSG